ncbi:MAG: TRAP transporter small permease [Desulfurivibrionaceae bacterium]|nr:TRAP transporter small permease [Desulfobulbales bacterium]MDT8334498.1 TRAP transporter small permease [Desulfurivibrionaceae bacterium]
MAGFSPEKILSGWYKVEETVLSLLLLLMITLACLQIGLRMLFSSGISWADPLLRYLVLWAGLLGAAVATRRGQHIAIDLVSHLLPDLLTHWLRIATEFLSLAVCLFLTYASVVFVINEASFGNGQIILGMSSWQLNLIFPISFGLISLHFLVDAVSGIRETISGKAR